MEEEGPEGGDNKELVISIITVKTIKLHQLVYRFKLRLCGTCSRPTRDQIQDLQPAHERSDPGLGNARKQTQPGTEGGGGSRADVETVGLVCDAQ
ncbi:hypothetical protein CgunFtcFv8_027754 [Champsocephalus gunnari]|uniref:Uncharacterized protein n=1 Tax=Champsocephalus gunnari TaxID=52237 RepID=A0AAN8E743_CHAGU|nr:hypothetical protein CgunFtcFv8_027754 [Champsocephalus gunnari]